MRASDERLFKTIKSILFKWNALAQYSKCRLWGSVLPGLSVVKHLVKYQPHTHVKVIDTRELPPAENLLPESVDLHSEVGIANG